jgi:hypothetical protein
MREGYAFGSARSGVFLDCANDRETLFDGGENADVSVGVALALGLRAVIVEKCLDAVGEVCGPLSINVDDQRRVLAVAVVDDDQEFVEAAGVSVAFELIGDGIS